MKRVSCILLVVAVLWPLSASAGPLSSEQAGDSVSVASPGFTLRSFDGNAPMEYKVYRMAVADATLQLWIPSLGATYHADETTYLTNGEGGVVALTPTLQRALREETLATLSRLVERGVLHLTRGSADREYLFVPNPGLAHTLARHRVPAGTIERVSARGSGPDGTQPEHEASSEFQQRLFANGVITRPEVAAALVSLVSESEFPGTGPHPFLVDGTCWDEVAISLLAMTAAAITCSTAWTNPLSAAGCGLSGVGTAIAITETVDCIWWKKRPPGEPPAPDPGDETECTDPSGCCPEGYHECESNQCCPDGGP